MSKRLIGIELGAGTLRVVIGEQGREGFEVRSFAQRRAATAEERRAALLDLIGTTDTGDRITTALPASCGYRRTLELPFGDPKKLAPVLRMEMASQLPRDISDALLLHSKPRKTEEGYEVPAQAVPRERMVELLESFEPAGFTPAVVEVMPHPLVKTYAPADGPALLLLLSDEEACLCACDRGEPLEVHSFNKARLLEPSRRHALLLRELELLAARHGFDAPAVILAGAGIDEALQQFLTEQGAFEVQLPSLLCEGAPLPAAFLPAAALAQRPLRPKTVLNLRQGEFALQSQWAGMRTTLIASAVCVLLALGVYVTSATLDYAHLSRKAERLQELINQQFRQTFPGVRTIVNAPAQMQTRLNEARQKMRSLGLLGDASALNLLREVSERTPEDIRVDVRNYLYDADSIRLEGVTTSFEAVNRLSASLKESELIGDVQITDAKMSVDGQQINFRLNLTLAGSQEAS